jgi:serine/threonine-protein kinase
MAEVHLALAHGASGFERHVAIKRLAPELAGDPDLERALIREATLGGTLHHRNLVAVLGLGVHDGGYYVVMEYVDGTDLARHLHGALPEPLALHIVHELALGLGYLHAVTGATGLPLGLVHRDVGPANVLVSTTGDVKLGDFGIAKATALADLTAAGARKGRYAYMAPEQLAGEPVTGAADQFGLGVTLVELVTGARPFTGELPWSLRDAILAGPPHAALAGLAPDLAAIAARTLAFDARDRFASIDELRGAIAEAQRLRPPVTALDLGGWVRAGLAAQR